MPRLTATHIAFCSRDESSQLVQIVSTARRW
jgi:hypothetical protein